MKRTTIILLSCVGALTLLVLARCVVGALSDENKLRKQFGSPKAIQALAELYGRVEKDGASLKPVGAERRDIIPDDWIPEELWRNWGKIKERHSRVAAYFDDKGALIAIEFADPCCGCFISRDATRCPASFISLYRLADKPLYVTAVVKDPE